MTICVNLCPSVVKTYSSQSGNILFYILMAIVLIGALTIALRDTGGMDSNINKENAKIMATEIARYSDEVANGAKILLNNGVSENDIRFAIPGSVTTYGDITSNPQNQIFSKQGGQTSYKAPPKNAATATSYSFSALRALPGVGSDKAELVMTLKGLTEESCLAVNNMFGITNIPSNVCGSDPTVFTGTYATSPSVFDTSTVPGGIAPRFCTFCSDRGDRIYYSTVISR